MKRRSISSKKIKMTSFTKIPNKSETMGLSSNAPTNQDKSFLFMNISSEFINDAILRRIFNLIKKKDIYGFFQNPVTDEMAPGYSIIIKNPMSFSTIDKNISAQFYKNLADFKNHFELIWSNAQIYNKPETIYFKEAQKLRLYTEKMFTDKKFRKLFKNLPILEFLDQDQSSIVSNTTNSIVENTEEHNNRLEECKRVLESLQNAAKQMHEKYLNIKNRPNYCAFEKLNTGEVILHVLNPDCINMELYQSTFDEIYSNCTNPTDLDSSSVNTEKMLCSYTSQYPSFNTYEMEYSQDQITALIETYGSVTGAVFAMSICKFVSNSTASIKNIVNSMLDNMLDQKHSTFLKEINAKYQINNTDLFVVLEKLSKANEFSEKAKPLFDHLQNSRSIIKSTLVKVASKLSDLVEMKQNEKNNSEVEMELGVEIATGIKNIIYLMSKANFKVNNKIIE